MTGPFTDAHEGARVVTAAGDRVGVIERVRDGTAYVRVDDESETEDRPDMDWGEMDAGVVPLQEEFVDSITDEEVRLRSLPSRS